MAAISVCDACGKQAPMSMGHMGHWFKPSNWFERTDFQHLPDGTLGRATKTWTACSRECINKLAESKGVSSLVLPV